MSVSSVTNSLTPSQIQQLLQPSVGSADSNGTAPTTEQDSTGTGQTLPASTESSTDTGATTGASQPSLDPKTILALLQIQESQMMASADPLIFGDASGSASTGDPLLDAMSGSDTATQTDPLQAIIDEMTTPANASTQSDPLQAIIDQLTAPAATSSSDTTSSTAAAATSTATAPDSNLAQVDPSQLLDTMAAMTGSAADTSALSTTNQSLLDLLNETSPPAPSTDLSGASAAEE